MPFTRHSFARQILACWNWKCALLSATIRSLVFISAMVHGSRGDRLAVVVVEMSYVTLTAGFYAALQQRALGLRSRILGDLIVVVGVPYLSLLLDWTAHYVTGAMAPARATLAVCIFAGLSALFHLYVMRNGVFLTGHGRSLAEDFRRMPRLIAGFVSLPFSKLAAWMERPASVFESDAAL